MTVNVTKVTVRGSKLSLIYTMVTLRVNKLTVKEVTKTKNNGDQCNI